MRRNKCLLSALDPRFPAGPAAARNSASKRNPKQPGARGFFHQSMGRTGGLLGPSPVLARPALNTPCRRAEPLEKVLTLKSRHPAARRAIVDIVIAVGRIFELTPKAPLSVAVHWGWARASQGLEPPGTAPRHHTLPLPHPVDGNHTTRGFPLRIRAHRPPRPRAVHTVSPVRCRFCLSSQSESVSAT